MFSVIIPTFNNINYLKICLESLKKNSSYAHEIIIHVNEGVDGTLEHVKNNNLKFSYSKNNSGVCVAFNKAAKLSTKNYIVLGHDDMYFCPGWDKVFFDEMSKLPANKDFFLSGTMIQPFKSFLFLDCGKDYKNFDEKKLLDNINQL